MRLKVQFVVAFAGVLLMLGVGREGNPAHGPQTQRAFALVQPLSAQEASPSVSPESALQGSVDPEELDKEESLITFDTLWVNLKFWRWPLILCLVVGILITAIKCSRLLSDMSRNRVLEKKPIHRLRMDQIASLVEKHRQGSLSGLLESLLEVYRTSRTIEALGAEIQLFRLAVEDRDLTARQWLAYISAAAGALGLLGTVYGMFLVFYKEGGVVDPTLAVYGMGVALVTTGVGIVISLIVDMGSTLLQTLSNRGLGAALQKAEQFREAAILDLTNTPEGGA